MVVPISLQSKVNVITSVTCSEFDGVRSLGAFHHGVDELVQLIVVHFLNLTPPAWQRTGLVMLLPALSVISLGMPS